METVDHENRSVLLGSETAKEAAAALLDGLERRAGRGGGLLAQDGGGVGALAAGDVAGAADADVADDGAVADLLAVKVLVEADDGPLGGAVGVARAADARVEAAGAVVGGDGLEGRGDAGGRGGDGGLEDVAGAATARVDVGVWYHRGVRLCDEDLGRHLEGCVCGVVLWCRFVVGCDPCKWVG